MRRFSIFENSIEINYLFFGKEIIPIEKIKYIEFINEQKAGAYFRIYLHNENGMRKRLNRFVHIFTLRIVLIGKARHMFSVNGEYYKLLLFYLERGIKIKIKRVNIFTNNIFDKKNDLKKICYVDENGWLIKR